MKNLAKNIIFSYTRKDAIRDNMQFQIPENLRNEMNINFPVFVTSKIWNDYLDPPKDFPSQTKEDRIYDLLTMFVFYLSRTKTKGNNLNIVVNFVMSKDHTALSSFESIVDENFPYVVDVTFKCSIGPLDIDDSSPAITIMLPNED